MKKKILRILNYLFFLSIGIFMVWWSLRPVDVRYIFSIIIESKLIYLFPVTVVLLFSHFVRALRWRLLTDSLKYYPTSLNLFLCIMVGYLFNLFVPRLGELIRCTLLSKFEKIPAEKIIGTVLVERSIDFLSLIAVTLIAFFLQVDLIGSFWFNNILPKLKEIQIANYIIYLTLAFLLLILFVKIFKRFTLFNMIFLKIKFFVSGVWEGIKTILCLKSKFTFFLLTVLMWSLYSFAIWLGFESITNTSGLGFIPTLSSLVMGSVGMIITQGGIGAYPLLIEKALSFYGVQHIYGIASGWMHWSVQFFICIIFGLISWITLPLYNNLKNKT